MLRNIHIGLFGFGTVGRGLYDLLHAVDVPGVHLQRVCVRHLDRDRHAPDVAFTDRAADVLDDPRVNLIVELIDDPEASYEIVTSALRRGLPVVTGNKKMLAAHLPKLIGLQRQTGTPLLYDASACGSIPVIRNLEEYYDNDLLLSVKGILNGSSNFVLSKIFNEGMPRPEALELARRLGFLEADPTLDLDGWDSLYKLVIIAMHAFGVYLPPQEVFTYGISSMTDADIRFALEKGRRIKLVATVTKAPDGTLCAAVMPQLVSHDKYIYSVEDEFNGVVIKGLFYDKQFMFGRGAGAKPTSSAVLSDITASQYGYRYAYKKLASASSAPTVEAPRLSNGHSFRVYYRPGSSLADAGELLRMERVYETYTTAPGGDGADYVVGDVTLASLLATAPALRSSGAFLAAYPRD